MLNDPAEFTIALIIILVALGIHEYAHAKVADVAGDPTPRIYGRVTLNLFKHLDPLGTLMIIITLLAGFGIGWGKPVPMTPSKMHNPRWDHFWAVAAGPISNLLQAAAFAMIFRLLALSNASVSPLVVNVLLMGMLINLSLCFFNLIPLGPLDGHWLVGALLPERYRYGWYRWNVLYGGFLLLALVFIGQYSQDLSVIGRVLRPAVEGSMRFLIGAPPDN